MYEKEIIRREPQKRRERKKKDGKEKKKEGTEIWKKKLRETVWCGNIGSSWVVQIRGRGQWIEYDSVMVKRCVMFSGE